MLPPTAREAATDLLRSPLRWLARAPWPLVRFAVVDDSMRPALWPGDRLVVVRAPLLRRPLGRGDVVVLRDPQAPGRFLVKRLAALPGDPWPAELPVAEGAAAGSAERAPVGASAPGPPLAAETFAVLGDDRARSRDSRAFGPVPRRLLVGRVVWRYLPASRRGRVPGGGPTRAASGRARPNAPPPPGTDDRRVHGTSSILAGSVPPPDPRD